MSIEILLAGAMAVSLTFYGLMGGADYGGGVWDLLIRGPRAARQRELIAEAIGPIWEANHVWLILVIVIMFTGFPTAFAAIATALHIPLTLMLFGIVLRGSAFVFRAYDSQEDHVQRRWGRIFAIASLATPLCLGITVGAIASGRISIKDGVVAGGFFRPWFAPFPIAVGFFALALFAFLAAVYLTAETADHDDREDFRRRAMIAGVLVGVLALAVFVLSSSGAPSIRRDLGASWWSLPLHLLTGASAVAAFGALWTRRYAWARLLAAGQTALILWGWAGAQFPFLVEPEITIYNAAAPQATLKFLLAALLAGGVVLFPSFYYLFRVFKGAHVAKS
jgi:cytochrome bd ubiquinol oxidase subunit II